MRAACSVLLLSAFLACRVAYAQDRTLLVTAGPHDLRESDFNVTSPSETNTNCNIYTSQINCQSTTDGGKTQTRAVYFLHQLVTSNENGCTVYTLAKTARWVWQHVPDWLNEGEMFPAEVKGKQMFVTAFKGGNQGKKVTLKYDIADMRPCPSREPEKRIEAAPVQSPPAIAQSTKVAAPVLSSVEVKSTPDGADITVDDKYMGNTPSTLKLAAGDHRIKLEKHGFKTWERTLTVGEGATATVNATLDKQ